MKLRKNRRTKWTEEERQKLKFLFEEFDGDLCRYDNLTDWVFVCGKCLNEIKQAHDETYQYGGTWKSKRK